jgi:hypothetical protein
VKVTDWLEIGNAGLMVNVALNAPGGEIAIACDVRARVSAESVTLSETVNVPEVMNV